MSGVIEGLEKEVALAEDQLTLAKEALRLKKDKLAEAKKIKLEHFGVYELSDGTIGCAIKEHDGGFWMTNLKSGSLKMYTPEGNQRFSYSSAYALRKIGMMELIKDADQTNRMKMDIENNMTFFNLKKTHKNA